MKKQIVIWFLIVLMVASFILPGHVNANVALQPNLRILVINPPADLELQLDLDGEVYDFSKTVVGWEAQFEVRFSDPKAEPLNGAILIVHSAQKSFRVTIPDVDDSVFYRDYLLLDFEHETITTGSPGWRLPVGIGIRLILTLIIEGIILFLFGYRDKKSWMTFLLVNIVTQGLLNLFLALGVHPGDYIYLALIFGELFFVYLVEGLVFGILLKEHTVKKAIILTLIANTASLVLGWILIGQFPI